jgi:hypothetical protein
MQPAAVVDRWWNEVWDGRVEVIDEIVAEPYVRHGRDGTRTQTREQLKADMAQYLRVHHRPMVTIADQVVSGSKVWSRVSSEAVNLETGEPSRISWLQIHRVDDEGRLAEVWTLYSHDAGWP